MMQDVNIDVKRLVSQAVVTVNDVREVTMW